MAVETSKRAETTHIRYRLDYKGPRGAWLHYGAGLAISRTAPLESAVKTLEGVRETFSDTEFRLTEVTTVTTESTVEV